MSLELAREIIEGLHFVDESFRRPGLYSVKGKVALGQMRGGLRRYFSAVKASLIKGMDLQVLDAPVAADVIANVIDAHSPVLQAVLVLNLQYAYIAGYGMAVVLQEAASTVRHAVTYATQRAGELITGLNRVTREQIAGIVAGAIERNKGAVSSTASVIRALQREFSELGDVRIERIARTEINDALSEGMMRRTAELGRPGKKILLAKNPCPICIANAQQGVIPFDQAFLSGQQRPTFHPNCDCTVVGVRPRI